MIDKNPYLSPNAKLEKDLPSKIPLVVYVSGYLSVLYSMWYLFYDGRNWFEPLPYIDSFEIVREWITRILYALPKIGLVLGLVALYKYKIQSFWVYLICWIVSIFHTLIFYGEIHYRLFPISISELLVLVIHHIIPHLFYLFMLVMLYRYAKSVTRYVLSSQIDTKVT